MWRMKVSAERLIGEAEKELSGLIEKISNHPYLRDLEAGRIGRNKLRIFVEQQYHTVNADLRSIALAVARAETPQAREFLVDSLNVEAEALKQLLSLGKALGLEEEDLKRSEPIAAALAYAYYITALVSYGSEHELVAAFLLDIPVWGGNCARMRGALERRYGIPGSALKFFELFSTPTSEEFREAALRIVEDGLRDERSIRNIKRACRLTLEYELMFWDTIYRASR